jgi:lipopolysaccharide heptosyltransferase II
MNIKKVLFSKPGAIGDLLHTLPALQAVKNTFPDAQVTVLVSPGLDSLIQGTPIADRVQIFDKSKFKKSFLDFIVFGMHLRNERYDLFVDMQPSARSFVLRLFSGAEHILIYRKQKNVSPGKQRIHAVNNFMDTLKPLGINFPADKIDLPLQEDARRTIDHFLAKQGLRGSKMLVALNCSVGAARPARNWFPERFAELADRLINELGADVIFIGGPEDRDVVNSVMERMKGKALSAAGDLSLSESAALLSRCSCLVSSDTGPLHLATAVHTPVVGLFGSTDPKRTGPVGKGHQVLMKDLSCVPCEKKNCPLGTRACMGLISSDEVFEAVRKASACA